MEHESPIMKAWREFALADPEDCERQYDAYITLVNRKAAVSGSSPTNSTSSLHHRAPAAAVKAPSTTRSTAPLSAPSNDMSSTAVSEESASRWDQDDVYPPLAELRRALMTDAEWAAMSEWEKGLWEMKHLPEEERMKSIEGVVMWLPVAQQDQRRKEILEEILRFGEPAPTLNSSRVPASTTDTSLVLPVAIELDVVQDAVDDQAAPTPTNCSSECPSKDAYTSVSVSISSATPNSSTTTGGIFLELAAPELSDKELDVDVMGDTMPLAAICLPGGPDPSTGGEDTMSMSLTPWSASTSFIALTGNLTSPWLAPLDVVQPFMWSPITCSTIHSSCCIDTPPSLLVEQQKVFNVVTTGTAIVPWPPPSLTRAKPPMIRGHDLFQHEQQKRAKEFLVKDSQGKWNANWIGPSVDRHPFERMKVVKLKPPWPLSLGVCTNLPMGWPDPPWPPPTPNRSTACTIFNLHSTLDENMQLSGDCQVLKIWELKCSAVSIVITFVPGYQKAQLTPTLFEWSIPSCLDRQFLSASTLDFLLARRAPHILWNWCCLDYLHCYLGSINWALQEEHRQVLLQIPWQSVGYHWEAAYLRKPCSAIQVLVALGMFWYKLFSVGETGDCLQYEHLQQWRPPDQVFSVACMGVFSLRFKDCWSDHSCYDTNYLLAMCHSMLSDVEVHSLVHAEMEGWFQFCSVGKASWYSYGTAQFQWTIAWVLSYHFPLSTLQTRLAGDILLMQHNSPAIYEEPWFTAMMDTMLSKLSDGLAVRLRSPSEVTCLQGNSVHELISCSLVVELIKNGMVALQELQPWTTWECVIFLQPKPPWSYVGPTISFGVAESLHVIGVCLEFTQFGLAPSHGSVTYGCLDFERKLMGHNFNCLLRLYSNYDQYITQDATYFGFQPTATYALLKMQPVGGHCKFYDAFLFSWDSTSIRVLAIKYISGDGILAHTKRVLIPWYPGGSVPVLDAATGVNWKSIQQPFLHLTWDPGGFTQHRLEGKPNFKEGGLSTTCLQELSHGPPHWSVACLAARYKGREAYIPVERPHHH